MRREPPDADPHVRWCGGRRGEPGAYPINRVTGWVRWFERDSLVFGVSGMIVSWFWAVGGLGVPGGNVRVTVFG
jgi:hypothetical protein